MCKRLFKALKMKMDNFKLRNELAGANEEIARLREHKEITDNLVEAYAQKCKKLEEENILLKSEKRISDTQLSRLTKKELCNYTNTDFYSIQMDWSSIYNKLAKFEDFMEEQGFESLEDLEGSMCFLRFSDGYNEETGEAVHKQEIIKYCDAYREEIKAYKNLWKKTQALKDMWNKLKEFIAERLETSRNDEWYAVEEIDCEIKELEKENNQ